MKNKMKIKVHVNKTEREDPIQNLKRRKAVFLTQKIWGRRTELAKTLRALLNPAPSSRQLLTGVNRPEGTQAAMSWPHWTSAPGLLQYLPWAFFRMWGLSVGDPPFPVDAALEPRRSSPLFCLRPWGRAEALSLLRLTPPPVGADGRYLTSGWPLQGAWASLQEARTPDRGGLPVEQGRDVSSQSRGPLEPPGHCGVKEWSLQPHRSLKAAVLPRLAAGAAIASLAWPPWRWHWGREAKDEDWPLSGAWVGGWQSFCCGRHGGLATGDDAWGSSEAAWLGLAGRLRPEVVVAVFSCSLRLSNLIVVFFLFTPLAAVGCWGLGGWFVLWSFWNYWETGF